MGGDTSTGPRGGQLYELRGPMRELRLQRGWSQGDLAKASFTFAQTISKIELGRTRITEDKALRLSDALGVALDEMFLCVLPVNTAAARVGMETNTLLAAVRDPRSPITPYATEIKDTYTRCYFIEDDLRAQLADLPCCAHPPCHSQVLRAGGYCKSHTWIAIDHKHRRALVRPVEERRWFTKNEVIAHTGRCAVIVDRAIAKGQLRSWRIGACRMIPKSDVAAWQQTFPPPRFSSEDIKEMRRLYETGLTCAEVGEHFGCSGSVINRRLKASGYTFQRGSRGERSEAQLEALRRARSAARNGEPTRIEIAGRTLLTILGVEFIEQYPVGVYTVDFYIPKIQCVIEADGWYWHQNEAKEKARDAYLLRDPSVRSVVHLTEEQLRPWTPKERSGSYYRNRKAAILAA